MHTHETGEQKLQAVMQRLSTIPPWQIDQINGEGQVLNWYTVSVQDIMNELCMPEYRVHEDQAILPCQVANWGRLTALMRRVWQIREKDYRVWRAEVSLRLYEPPADPPKGWKRPTKEMVDNQLRLEPGYQEHQRLIEQAEEACSCCEMVMTGFKIKASIIPRKRVDYEQNAAG